MFLVYLVIGALQMFFDDDDDDDDDDDEGFQELIFRRFSTESDARRFGGLISPKYGKNVMYIVISDI